MGAVLGAGEARSQWARVTRTRARTGARWGTVRAASAVAWVPAFAGATMRGEGGANMRGPQNSVMERGGEWWAGC